jgi:hypothetical protein
MVNENFPTFNDIEYKPLQTWNRCVMFFNLKEDAGQAVAERYARSLPKGSLPEMYAMYQRVLKEGREKVFKEVTHNMPLQEDEEEHIVH